LFGLLLDVMGRGVLLVSGGLCLSALAALLVLKPAMAPASVEESGCEFDA
jgi:hypothetical protein